MNTIYTLATSDHYQHYIPLFVYAYNRVYPEAEIVIGIRGYADELTKEALRDYEVRYTTPSDYSKGKIIIIQNLFNTFPVEYINALRFLSSPTIENDVFVTDVDMFPTNHGIIEWCKEQARVMQSSYYSPHGARKYPKRFSGGWTGDNERLTGGCVFLTQKWYEATDKARRYYLTTINNLYREYDEVMLCRICKALDMPIAQSRYYPHELMGIHLGDFKFDGRWTDTNKMQRKAPDATVKEYKRLLMQDSKLKYILDIVRKDSEINKIMYNVDILCEGRL